MRNLIFEPITQLYWFDLLFYILHFLPKAQILNSWISVTPALWDQFQNQKPVAKQRNLMLTQLKIKVDVSSFPGISTEHFIRYFGIFYAVE